MRPGLIPGSTGRRPRPAPLKLRGMLPRATAYLPCSGRAQRFHPCARPCIPPVFPPTARRREGLTPSPQPLWPENGLFRLPCYPDLAAPAPRRRRAPPTKKVGSILP
jgi:hypothetical protein